MGTTERQTRAIAAARFRAADRARQDSLRETLIADGLHVISASEGEISDRTLYQAERVLNLIARRARGLRVVRVVGGKAVHHG